MALPEEEERVEGEEGVDGAEGAEGTEAKGSDTEAPKDEFKES